MRRLFISLQLKLMSLTSQEQKSEKKNVVVNPFSEKG